MRDEETGLAQHTKKIAISLHNVSKEFKVYSRPGGGGTNNSSQSLSALLGRAKYEKIQVLRDVSFDIVKGEMVGILGRNGAGKSTLLRIVAGIMEPSSGTVKVNGKVTSLMGLTTGLNKKLTARENIIQYGLILGLSKREIAPRVQEVLELAELEKFADVQISHFSSGMNARLAFSTTMLVNPDILLLDEALAVGDYYFHQKSVEMFERIKKKSGTIVLVSHSLANIRKHCNKVLLLNNGVIEAAGDPDTVIRKYLDLGLDADIAAIAEQFEGDESSDFNPLTVVKKADLAETPAIEQVVVPLNLFPDGSAFLAGMPKTPIKRLRWRAKVLIENNAFAIKDKSVLDLRCQNGQFMYAALETGARYVEGIEKQQDLVQVAMENLKHYHQNTDGIKYKVNQGALLAVLRKIKPNTFDTIFCFGVMNKLLNQTGLMEQISRLQPHYLILEVNVSESSEAVTEFGTADKDVESIEDGKNIGLPSKSALELLLTTYKYKFEYIDWTKAGISNWSSLEEYLNNQRVSIIASRI